MPDLAATLVVTHLAVGVAAAALAHARARTRVAAAGPVRDGDLEARFEALSMRVSSSRSRGSLTVAHAPARTDRRAAPCVGVVHAPRRTTRRGGWAAARADRPVAWRCRPADARDADPGSRGQWGELSCGASSSRACPSTVETSRRIPGCGGRRVDAGARHGRRDAERPARRHRRENPARGVARRGQARQVGHQPSRPRRMRGAGMPMRSPRSVRPAVGQAPNACPGALPQRSWWCSSLPAEHLLAEAARVRPDLMRKRPPWLAASCSRPRRRCWRCCTRSHTAGARSGSPAARRRSPGSVASCTNASRRGWGTCDSLGGALGKACASYDQAVGSLEQRVLVSARRLENLSAGAPDRQLDRPRAVPSGVRRLIALRRRRAGR